MPIAQSSPIAKTLTQIGLSDKQAVIYEALLNLGKANIGKLLPKIPYKRGNTYDILEELKQKNLVSEIEERGKKVFVVEPPTSLERFVDQQEQAVVQQRKLLNDNLNQLKSLYDLTISKPVIQYFEGVNGLKQIYEHTLCQQDDKKIMVFRSIYDDKRVYDYLMSYQKRRAGHGIEAKIFSPSQVTEERLQKDKKLLIQRKYLPREVFSLPTEIDIFQNKVALLSFRKKLIGVIIDNKDFADSMKTIFMQLWEKVTQ